MPDSFTIFDMSDLHLGSPNTSEESIEEVVKYIGEHEDIYVIFKGDAIEAILPNDKRYLHSCVKEGLKSPKEQADRVIELFNPIRERILVWMIGNHELKLWNTMDFGRYIADSLQCRYGAYNCKISYFDKQDVLMFKTYHTHGFHGLRSGAKDDIQYEANRKAALKQQLVKAGHSDVIYMSRGHDHQLIVVEPTVQNKLYLTDDGKGVHQRYHQASVQNADYIPPDSRWYATTGSFRKLYSRSGLGTIDYAEMMGLAPAELGFVCLDVVDKVITNVRRIII